MTVAISVVITCYNYSKYVGDAICSAISQSYKPVEIIVVNDGSQDESWDVISEYSDRVIAINQANIGFSRTINQIFRKVQGAWVLFLDADDVLHLSCLSEAVAAISNCRSSNISKVQFDMCLIDENSRIISGSALNFDDDNPETIRTCFKKTGTYRWPVMSGNIYAVDFLRKVMPLDPPIGHDGVWNTIAPLYGDVVTIPKALVNYRLHNNNMSRLGATKGAVPDLVKAIDQRNRELSILEEHARMLNISLNVSALDCEYIFVSYRIMCKARGIKYEGDGNDTPYRLLGFLVNAMQNEQFNAVKFGYLFLFHAVILALPKSMADILVRSRFTRGRLYRYFKRNFN